MANKIKDDVAGQGAPEARDFINSLAPPAVYEALMVYFGLDPAVDDAEQMLRPVIDTMAGTLPTILYDAVADEWKKLSEFP